MNILHAGINADSAKGLEDRHTHVGTDGRHQQNSALVLLQHFWKNSLHAVDRPHEIHVHHFFELFRGLRVQASLCRAGS
jgi:hypothetical protein